MNENKVRSLIDFYIENEDAIHSYECEGYKWTILSAIRTEISEYKKNHYTDGVWDEDSDAFSEFMKKTVRKAGNLVYSSAQSVMIRAAKKEPKKVHQMFVELMDESSCDLEKRVSRFIDAIESLVKENSDISSSGKSFHTDFRSVSVYLFLLKPDKYYNYMYSTFYEFGKFVEIKIPKAGDGKLLVEYYKVCGELRKFLLSHYEEWFLSYISNQRFQNMPGVDCADIDGHLLVQNIVYSLCYYNNKEIDPCKKKAVHPTICKRKPNPIIKEPKQGVKADYAGIQRKNLYVGEAAENFVFDNERRLVAEYGFDPNRVVHTSKVEGDSVGYDILSCDENGNETHIEVKGTQGGITTPFYITLPELKCSIEHPDKYRLYRVYDLKIAGTTGTGKISVIRGSLESYCTNPIVYEIRLE